MASSILRGHVRDASSPCTLFLLLLTVSLLLACYLSSSSERLELRTHEARLLARIRTDASSLEVLVNATRRIDHRLRDAMRRVARLTRDNEEYKSTVTGLKKETARLRKQRFQMFQRRMKMHMELMKQGKINKTSSKALFGDSVYFYEESSSDAR